MTNAEPTIRTYIEVVDPDDVDAAAYQAAMNELEDDVTWSDEYTGETIIPSVFCRGPRNGEALGTYEVLINGDLQILGYSVPVPEALRDLTERAFSKALED